MTMEENAAMSFRMLLATDDSETRRRRLEPDAVPVLTAHALLGGVARRSAT